MPITVPKNLEKTPAQVLIQLRFDLVDITQEHKLKLSSS